MKDNIINIININLSEYKEPNRYNNGYFMAVFCDAMKAIACNRKMAASAKDVLYYLVASADQDNHINVNTTLIASEMKLDRSTVHKALKTLTKMRLLGRDAKTNSYRLSPNLINIVNPRFAYYGNTKRLNKMILPELLSQDGKTPLIPGTISTYSWDNPCEPPLDDIDIQDNSKK